VIFIISSLKTKNHPVKTTGVSLKALNAGILPVLAALGDGGLRLFMRLLQLEKRSLK